MNGIYIYIGVVILFIIIFFIGFKFNNVNEHFIRFYHLNSSLAGLIDIKVNDNLIKNLYFNKISEKIKVNPGKNKIKILCDSEEILCYEIEIVDSVNNICVFDNFENIFIIKMQKRSQILNLVDNYGPLFIKNKNKKQKIRYGNCINMNLINGENKIKILDFKNDLILTQSIYKNDLKNYILTHDFNCDEKLKVYEIDENINNFF